MSLTDTLFELGLFHYQSGIMGKHHICTSAGEVLFTGRAHEVWAWLSGVTS